MVAIDASRSTVDPAGVDIDEDGRVGKRVWRRKGRIFDEGSSDPGDSYLAAQLLAVRNLVHGLRDRGNRFAIVAWAGELSGGRSVRTPDIRFTFDFESDPQVVDASLQEILRAGSLGNSNLAAPIDHGLDLLEPHGSESGRFILLMSDSPESYPADTVGRWRIAVARASRSLVVINTFALGERAMASPEILAAISEATGGVHRPIEDPSQLHCELAASLRTP